MVTSEVPRRVGLSVACCLLSFSVVALGVADCSQMLSYEEAAESGKEAVNTFGLRLLAGLSRRGRANGGNALISPASVAAALGMAAAGATTGSDAHLELEGALMGISLKQCNGSTVLATALLGGTKSSEGSGVDISVANSGWFDASVLQSYKDNIKEWYDAETGPVSTGEVINEWVSRKTKGHVKKLVDSGPLGAVAVLVNAIHFKGSWTTAFNKNHTRTGSFETPEGLVEANMMLHRSPFVAWIQREGLPVHQVIELDFGINRSYSAMVALPLASPGKDMTMHNRELDQLVEALAADQTLWKSWQEQVMSVRSDSWTTKTNLRMPRFKVEASTDLIEPLKELGIKAALGGQRGQFLELSTSVDLYISHAVHASALEVDEEGATAAAATAVMMSRSLPMEIEVRRPFLFFIRNNQNGLILFADPIPHWPSFSALFVKAGELFTEKLSSLGRQ